MSKGDQRAVARFEEELAAVPAVVLAQRLFGEPDYLLRVRCRDAADYQRIRDASLAALPGVGRLSSTLVMKDVVRDRGSASRIVIGRSVVAGLCLSPRPV